MVGGANLGAFAAWAYLAGGRVNPAEPLVAGDGVNHSDRGAGQEFLQLFPQAAKAPGLDFDNALLPHNVRHIAL